MERKSTPIKDVYLFELEKFEDERGFFLETWNSKKFGLPEFVQDNLSRSKKGVLRGLHYQEKSQSQDKLVCCTSGVVFDVIVDLREKSSSFGKWFSIRLDRPDLQLWIPKGIAHGFYTLSDTADFLYKVTNYYDPLSEKVLIWNDIHLAINWPNTVDPLISKKDSESGKTFLECEKFIN